MKASWGMSSPDTMAHKGGGKNFQKMPEAGRESRVSRAKHCLRKGEFAIDTWRGTVIGRGSLLNGKRSKAGCKRGESNEKGERGWYEEEGRGWRAEHARFGG